MVHGYMAFVQQNAETAVRNMLRDAAKKAGSNVLQSIDYLDDGSPITVRSPSTRHPVTPSSTSLAQVQRCGGNLNAPISVVHSAIIYWYVGNLSEQSSADHLAACVRWSTRIFR